MAISQSQDVQSLKGIGFQSHLQSSGVRESPPVPLVPVVLHQPITAMPCQPFMAGQDQNLVMCRFLTDILLGCVQLLWYQLHSNRLVQHLATTTPVQFQLLLQRTPQVGCPPQKLDQERRMVQKQRFRKAKVPGSQQWIRQGTARS